LAAGEPGTAVVASARSVAQRISPSNPEPISGRVGEDMGFDRLIESLARAGYHRTDRVEARGEFSVRGGIVDVFPAQGDEPVRLDFWGDHLEEARIFSVSSQRSVEKVGGLVAYPAREFRPDPEVSSRAQELLEKEAWAAATWDRLSEGLLFSGMESWLPWLAPPVTAISELAPDGLVVVFDRVRAGDRSRDLRKEEAELAAALAPTWGHGAPEAGNHPAFYLDLEAALNGRPLLDAPAVPAGPEDRSLNIQGFEATPGDPDSVAAGLGRLLERKMDVVVAMDGVGAADRVAKVLTEAGLSLPRVDLLDQPGSAVLPVGIHRGFVLPGPAVAVLGEPEVAGRRRAHRRTGPRRSTPDTSGYRDLTDGDYVVHYRHGIGKFEGLATRTIARVERDYLLVGYAAGDKLYVPTDQLAAVRKYTGGETPRISRMGGADWSATRSKVRKAVAAVAEQVMSLHKARAAAPGYAYAPDAPWQRELEAAFPFEETPDQLSAIQDVKVDMENAGPMDRLVFGDVGFGKTEIAIRAAFKTVMEGKQAAILCPTTLLAQQHFQTFSDRYSPYPVRVEMLSRFLTVGQQRGVIEGLATGEVDVVIGTHRLISDDIKFKDLGLLVIDEEQRFGVNAKDKIKRFRVGVDVVTLTATPIPRTLEMALTGI
jgi:transcription-repair coupling factor (superfamily II helicase)